MNPMKDLECIDYVCMYTYIALAIVAAPRIDLMC